MLNASATRIDGAISVHNRCRTDSGFDDATGKATVVEGFGNSRLKVSFFWPFKADYWVLGLDADYRWAVVGNPNRKYLWVLSRTPQLPPALLEAALASATAQGFDLSQLRYTVLGGQDWALFGGKLLVQTKCCHAPNTRPNSSHQANCSCCTW